MDIPIQENKNRNRESRAKKEEEIGRLCIAVISNDGKTDTLMKLVDLKNIFARQLPKMPKEYITRLLFDYRHCSLLLLRKQNPDDEDLEVIGGITYRPFADQGFIEIVFCAMSSNDQVRGYGTRMMNHLKEYVKKKYEGKVLGMLTYADNFAVGYFRKQGFTKHISMPRERWTSFIKDYEGGTLMECRISYLIDYLNIHEMLQLQRTSILEKVREISSSHIVRPGLTCFEDPHCRSIGTFDIPGVKESGYVPPIYDSRRARPTRVDSPLTKLIAKLGAVLKQVRQFADSWPFHEPVCARLVPDYYSVISNPMDFKTIEKNLNSHKYRTKDEFVSDFRLIIKNCRTYNGRDTVFWKSADATEKYFNQLIIRVSELT